MKLGIVGSRKRHTAEDLKLVVKRVRELQPDMLISGGCTVGADEFAELIARNFGIPITIYHPKLETTNRYPRHEVVKAMYARNKLIANESDYLIALVAPNRKGGTENTIDYFKNSCGGKTWTVKLEIL